MSTISGLFDSLCSNGKASCRPNEYKVAKGLKKGIQMYGSELMHSILKQAGEVMEKKFLPKDIDPSMSWVAMEGRIVSVEAIELRLTPRGAIFVAALTTEFEDVNTKYYEVPLALVPGPVVIHHLVGVDCKGREPYNYLLSLSSICTFSHTHTFVHTKNSLPLHLIITLSY
jgi:hypothetical protein